MLLTAAAALDDDWSALGRGAAAGAIAFAIYFLLHMVSPRSMGFGDVKLSFSLGLALGWLGWGELFLGLFLGFLYGAVIGVVLIAFTVALSRLKPAAPSVDLNTVWIDTVKKGQMIRQERGLGTLVPEDAA